MLRGFLLSAQPPLLGELSVGTHLTPRFDFGNIGRDGGLWAELHQRDDKPDSGKGGSRTGTVASRTVAAGMQVDGLADAAWRLARRELPKGVSDIAPAE